MSKDSIDDIIRRCAQRCNIVLSTHAKKRMRERGIIMSDIIHLLKNGIIDDDFCQPSTRSKEENLNKYKIYGKTPNSSGREIALVLIPSMKSNGIKVITIMWKDLDK